MKLNFETKEDYSLLDELSPNDIDEREPEIFVMAIINDCFVLSISDRYGKYGNKPVKISKYLIAGHDKLKVGSNALLLRTSYNTYTIEYIT